MAGFTISCRENLILVGYSTIIISVIKFISVADIYTDLGSIKTDKSKEKETNHITASIT
jgi:hypothetical protein